MCHNSVQVRQSSLNHERTCLSQQVPRHFLNMSTAGHDAARIKGSQSEDAQDPDIYDTGQRVCSSQARSYLVCTSLHHLTCGKAKEHVP